MEWFRRHRISLAILALALALRLVNLTGRPLWYDEALAVLYAEKPLQELFYGTVAPTEGPVAANVHPLLYHLGLHAWMKVAGQSPFAIRLPSALMGVAAVWLVGLLCKAAWEHCQDSGEPQCRDTEGSGRADVHRGGSVKSIPRIAMLVAAVAPFPIAYSQEARMYSLLGVCALGATYSAWRARQNRGWWLAYTLFGALTLYTHNLGVLTLAALNLLLLAQLTHPFRLSHLSPFLLANLGMLVLFAPWLLLVLPGQIGFVRRSYWVTRPGATELVRSLIVYHFNLPLPDWLLPLALSAAVLVLVLLAYRLARLRARTAAAFLWLATAPLAMMWLLSQWQPVYIERAVLPAALLYTVVVGWLLAAGGLPRWLLGAVSCLCLLVAGVSLVYHYTYADFPRAPYRETVNYLEDRTDPDDAIVHSNKLTFFPMHYYNRQMPATWIADPAGDGSDTLTRPMQEALGLRPSPSMEAAVGGARRIWFVIFDQAIAEWGGHHPHLDWLEANYQLVGVRHFRQVRVYRYEE